MSWGKDCLETIFLSQLSRNYPHREGNFERGKCPLLWARGNLGGISGDNLGEGHCESKIVSRQWGDNFCRETSKCLAGLSWVGWGSEVGAVTIAFCNFSDLRHCSTFALETLDTEYDRAKVPPYNSGTKNRKVPVSVKFLSAILGPKMAAPILWTPGKKTSVLQERPSL